MTRPDHALSAGPVVEPADPGMTRVQQRAREAAEDAEFDALLDRLRAHQPNFGCFCGSLDDLRRTVADLDRHHSNRDPSTPPPTAAHSAHDQTGNLLARSLATPPVPPDADPDTRTPGWETHSHQTGVAGEASDPDAARAAMVGSEPDPLLGARTAGIRARHALDPGGGDDEELRREQLTQWHADDTSRRPELTADLIDTTFDGPCGGDSRSNGEGGWSR